jgi:hypothetical protein
MNSYIYPGEALKLCTKERHFFINPHGEMLNYSGRNGEWVINALQNGLTTVIFAEWHGPMTFEEAKAKSVTMLTHRLASIKYLQKDDFVEFENPKILKKKRQLSLDNK